MGLLLLTVKRDHLYFKQAIIRPLFPICPIMFDHICVIFKWIYGNLILGGHQK